MYFGDYSDAQTLLVFTLVASAAYHLALLLLHMFSTVMCGTSVLSMLLVVFSAVSFLSNSFIIYESDVLRFLAQTSLAWFVIGFLRRNRYEVPQESCSLREVLDYRNEEVSTPSQSRASEAQRCCSYSAWLS